MRKYLSVLVAVLGMLILPAAAQAHHVDINKSSAVCVLVNNVPTLQVNVLYVDFEEYNKPVSWTITINGAFDSTGMESWPASENPHYHKWSKPVAGGTSYSIVYSARWGRGYTATIPFETVICPQPVVPPQPPVVVCNGVTQPPGTPANYVCPAPPPPAPPTTPVCSENCSPPPPPPCVLTRAHTGKVHAGLVNTISVHTSNLDVGTVVTLTLPGKRVVTTTVNSHGHAIFRVKPKKSGVATVAAGECSVIRVKIHRRHHTTRHHRPPRTVG